MIKTRTAFIRSNDIGLIDSHSLSPVFREVLPREEVKPKSKYNDWASMPDLLRIS